MSKESVTIYRVYFSRRLAVIEEGKGLIVKGKLVIVKGTHLGALMIGRPIARCWRFSLLGRRR